MSFARLRLTGYSHPKRFVDEFKLEPALRWGFCALLLARNKESGKGSRISPLTEAEAAATGCSA